MDTRSFINNNHFFELLKKIYLLNTIKQKINSVDDSESDCNNRVQDYKTSNSDNIDFVSFGIEDDTSSNEFFENNSTFRNPIANESNSVNTITLLQYLKKLVVKKEYLSSNSLLYSLIFNETDEFLIISTSKINENLRHIDSQLDRVLHQTKFILIEKQSYMPICYLEKSIKESDYTYINPENSYLRRYVYDKIKDYHTAEFDKNKFSVYVHHIGSYVIIFHHSDKWYFILHNNVYEFNCNNHPVLYEHIGDHMHKFNKSVCYHLMLIDTRIRRLIIPSCDRNHVILIKVTEKYTLSSKPISYIDKQTSGLIHDVLIQDKRVFFSCLDELQVHLEELDAINIKMKRLHNRGYIVSLYDHQLDHINISYDTTTYKRIISMVPAGMSIHEVHLKLYQNDKLNYFLQYITDSYNDIVKRINISMSTLSREILDIYHMTRKKKNSDLYNILPQSYRRMLYKLHSNYIAQKNKKDSVGQSFELDDIINEDLQTDNELNDNCEGKVSISVDNVYTKLKELDIYNLVELYKDRDELINSLTMHNLLINQSISPIKACTSTKIHSKLLSMKSPI